jgi:hypothetical protein
VVPPAAAGTVAVLPTPTGAAQSMLFAALANATTMAPLSFSINPVLAASEPRSRVLLGWALQGGQASSMVLNQGCARRP